MDGQSLDISQNLIEQLKALVPGAFSEGKLDIAQLKTILGDAVNTDNERYQLSWAGKSDAYKVLQVPSTATLIPNPDESVDWDNAQNIFIEGENLEVLKVLQKSYYGKIKMIYIDPPYNTGSDSFIYPDKFSETKDEYLKRIGDKNEEGVMMKEGIFKKNSKENGQYHSNWLNMMLPRLFLARNLLKDDGVIFVSIDDNEQANLKLLMDDIFGEENFIANFIWEKRTNRENRKMVSVRHDYVLCYCKNINQQVNVINMLPMSSEALERYKNPDKDPRGLWKSDPATAQSGHATKSQFYTLYAPNGNAHELQSGRCWLYTEDLMNDAIKDGKIWFGKDGNGVPRIKTYLNSKERGLTPESILFASEASTTESSKTRLKELFDGNAIFETPKPFQLIQLMLKMATASECVVLDFFAGSGSLTQAVMELNEEDGGNRKYICVQLPELTEEDSEANKAGYKTIAGISLDRIKKVIKKIEKELEGKLELGKKQNLGFRKYTLDQSNFKIWRGDSFENEEEVVKQMEIFTTPQRANAQTENILWELLIKNGVSLTERVHQLDLGDGQIIYYTDNKRHAFVLDKYTKAVQDKVLELQPKSIICLDTLFAGNDNDKTNAQLKFEDSHISFKTI